MDENKNYGGNQDILNQNPYEKTVSAQDAPTVGQQGYSAQQPNGANNPRDPFYQNNAKNPFNQPQYNQPQQQAQPYAQPQQQGYQQPVQNGNFQQVYPNQQYGAPNQQYQPYPNNNMYNNQYQVDPEEKKAQNFGVASLILGIVSFFCCGLFSAIPGLVLGIVSIKKKKENNGLAVAGIIISSIALVITVVVMIIYIVAIVSHPEAFRTSYYYKLYH